MPSHKSIIDVQLGEFLNIHCPVYDFNEKSYKNVEYHTLYMVSKDEYDDCRIKKNSPVRQILRCDKPFENVKYTFYISTFSPIPGAIEFQPGNDYYFISTSNGTLNGLNNTEYGSCRTNNMKMIIRVLASIKRKHYSPLVEMDKTTPVTATTTTTTRAMLTTAKKKITSYSLLTSKSLKSDGSDMARQQKEMEHTYTYVELPFIDAKTTTAKSDIFILEPDDYSDLISQFISKSNTNDNSDKKKQEVGSLKSSANRQISSMTILTFCLILIS